MPSEEYLTTSTGLPEIYFDGTSLSDLGMSYNQSFLVSDDIKGQFSGTVGAPEGALQFAFESQGEDAVLRTLCCMLIAVIPTTGLLETVDTLKGIREHYTDFARNRLTHRKQVTTKGRTGSKSMRQGSYLSE